MALDDEWQRDASCARIENADAIFFPPQHKGQKTDYTRAKSICSTCPVRAHCLAYAIAHKISHGVWGGLSATERKRLDPMERRRLRRVWVEIHPISSRGRR